MKTPRFYTASLSVLLLASLLPMLWSCGGGTDSAQPEATDSIPEAAAAPTEISIVFAGDAMQHKRQLEAALRPDGTYDYSGYFTAVEPYINSADYAVVNLETTLAENDFSGYPMFCSPISYAQELKRAGFDMLLTANNHCLDRRDEGLKRTINVLDTLGVAHLGTYRNQAERDAALPMIVDISGFKIAFLDYTYGTNGIPVQGNVVVDYIDRDLIKSDIAKARDKGAEIVCVNIHWGVEYVLLPNAEQKALADFLVGEGADLVIGGHPHVIQPIEARHDEATGRDALVVYSMGNFISDMKKRDTQGGIMVKAWLKRGDDGIARFDRAEYLPVFVLRGVPGVSNYRLEIADSTAQAADFLESAYGIFDKHNVNVPRSGR